MKKWKVGVALVCTSVLLGFAANQEVEAAIHSYGTIDNVNQQEGTYDVTIHATTDEMGIDGIREVSVPIWSTKNQSDIVWYKAKHQGKGVWKVRMNAKNHKNHRGNYTTHIYIYSKNGQVEGINAGQTKLNNVLSAEIKNVNTKAGTYDVIVKDHIGGAVDRVSVPIWSKDQSDLVWYPAKKQADGTWVVHMNIKNHKFHTGKYTTHVYMYTKNQGVHAISLGQTNVQSETEQLKGQIKNVNAKAGSYDIVVQAKSGAGIKQVSVPIWSKANQSDLVWYPAKKQADGSYVVHMNIKNHKYHTGNYTTHVYATKNNGTEMAINLGQTDIPRVSDELSAKITNVNQQNGTYDVLINAQAQGGIREVYVPTWSKPDQSDIVWYKAQKQADGSYRLQMNVRNHHNNRGTYISHVYAYSNRGTVKAINAGETKLNNVLTAEIKNVNTKVGTYDVVVKDHIGGAVDSVSVPIWSTKNQSDLVWYPAKKQADGTWVVHMNIKNHKFHTGKYTTHVYMYTKNQGVHAISLGQTNVQSETEQLKGQIKNVNAKAGSYDIVVQAKSGAGIKQVSVPIWSKANQSDLVWYPAKKQADGSYVVHMNIKNHMYHTGNYTTHVYAWKNNGTEMAINLGQTNIQGIKDQLSAAIKNVNQQNGTYDIVVNASSQFGVREVKVPIWSTPNQSDLVWYKAQKQADGSYVVHMNIKNHKNHRGTYMTHVYMYNNRGQQTAIALNNTNLPVIPDTLKAQVKNVNKEAGSYDVIIQAASQQGIERVEVPTWSTKNQSDLVWYKAQKQADGSYIVHMNIKNHKNNRGNYTSHVYLWHPDGSNTAISLGETDLTKPNQEQPKPTEEPGKSENNQQGNTNTGNTTEPTKPTEQPGKTEEPQVRELDIEKIKSEIVRLVNIERQSKGLNQLSVDTDLEQTANIRSIEIQTKFDHVRPNGTIAYTAFNVDSRNLGENLVQDWHIAGLNETQIATNLFNSWKNSPGHYKNMTSEIWTRIGVGISFNSTKQGIYGVQFFSTEPTQLDVNEDGNVEIPLN
ncbi:GBS Bsp-like repeat-containing protein [Enterococcus cecorum]|uniref:GBS Bsp-like repeat-containing protein n=1 Tax=Enterococcus cecorum TaxID=44008 RepID=UPI002ACA5843|nr:GBS Bsp-like repeat-containing protein [Enterococcus cecorum]MDZ5439574.1 GBS Bsp-like repeat-containing protein [Enterococcus cecorum]MDZ5497627.1 GBS Bsp-like repeat-containing protein [Enterococcus cecorum]MDZ5562267.1 GBS Bsp-like repeat-containing protein [Enterococcus cecorum]